MFQVAEKTFRRYFPKKFKHLDLFRSAVKGKRGIEIGGPTLLFDRGGLLPLYDCIEQLDGCNFSISTVWEGQLEEGNTFRFGDSTGQQLIAECTDLSVIKNNEYDFLLSCHCLEHVANPLKALNEWKRIIKINGYLVLVLPHKDKTFDHNRPVTSLNHIIKDYENDIDEKDETHFDEIMRLHDLALEFPQFSHDELKMRLKKNYENRCAHHHVFDSHLTLELLDYAGLKLLCLHAMSNSVFALAQVVQEKPDNKKFFLSNDPVYNNEKYPSDFIYSSNKTIKH